MRGGVWRRVAPPGAQPSVQAAQGSVIALKASAILRRRATDFQQLVCHGLPLRRRATERDVGLASAAWRLQRALHGNSHSAVVVVTVEDAASVAHPGTAAAVRWM